MKQVENNYVFDETAKPVYYGKGARVAFYSVNPKSLKPVKWADVPKHKVTQVFKVGSSGVYWITRIGINDNQRQVGGYTVGNKAVYERWYKNECNKILMKQLAQGY
jgi:hypothetical protein